MNNLGNLYFPKKGELGFARQFVAQQMKWEKMVGRKLFHTEPDIRISMRQAAHHIYMTLTVLRHDFNQSVPVVTDDGVEPVICDCGAELSAGQECDPEDHAELAAHVAWHGEPKEDF